MKTAFLLLATLGLVFGAIGLADSSHVAQAQAPALTACDVMNLPLWDGGLWDSAGTDGAAVPFSAGDIVTITAGPPYEGNEPPTSFSYWLDGTLVATEAYPGTLVYVVPADIMVSGFLAQINDGRAIVTWSASCTPAPPAETPEGVPVVPVPGCDALITLPSNAVVGAFVSTAPLFYAPGHLVTPYTELEAGKTAWVLGQDASGGYRKILWGCQFVWVPLPSMGPNYDAVWNGTPLPTGVVE